jgi:MFS family permease
MLRFLLLISLLVPFALSAQDSTVVSAPPAADSVAVDSLQKPGTLQKAPTISFDSSRNYIITKMLKLNTQAKPAMVVQQPKKIISKDWLFYYILGLLLMFAALRLTYARYFKDLFRFFFRTSLRVDQIREQLVQSGLQSLLYNIFFAFSFGVYVYLLSMYFKSSLQVSAWLIPVGATACLLLLYLGKYLFFKFSGWLFGMKTATETYTFIVFLINKVAGIAILPFLIVIAFSSADIVDITVTLSLILVGGLFLYRFLRAYQPVQSEIKVSRLHFFIFFLAVEIAPLLIIYKVLVHYL